MRSVLKAFLLPFESPKGAVPQTFLDSGSSKCRSGVCPNRATCCLTERCSKAISTSAYAQSQGHSAHSQHANSECIQGSGHRQKRQPSSHVGHQAMPLAASSRHRLSFSGAGCDVAFNLWDVGIHHAVPQIPAKWLYRGFL